MLKNNYYKILVGLLLFIIFLIVIFVYMEKNINLYRFDEYSHYFLSGNDMDGEFYVSGKAYKNEKELWIFLGEFCYPITEKNKEYKYYRVDVYLDGKLIDSEESRKINLYDYWNNYKLFKRVKFTKDDFKLVMKVYDKEKGDSLYEKEITVERFI